MQSHVDLSLWQATVSDYCKVRGMSGGCKREGDSYEIVGAEADHIKRGNNPITTIGTMIMLQLFGRLLKKFTTTNA